MVMGDTTRIYAFENCASVKQTLYTMRFKLKDRSLKATKMPVVEEEARILKHWKMETMQKVQMWMWNQVP